MDRLASPEGRTTSETKTDAGGCLSAMPSKSTLRPLDCKSVANHIGPGSDSLDAALIRCMSECNSAVAQRTTETSLDKRRQNSEP
jgi:hypothetical protein